MPYVTVPKDFTTIKNKVFLGMTKRQLIAAASATLICLPTYYFLSKAIGDLALYLVALLAVPIFLTGFYHHRDGRPLEKVFMNYITVRYRRPLLRPYRTENIYAGLEPVTKIQEVIKDAEPDNIAEDNNDKKARSLRGSAKAGKKKGCKAR